MAATFDSTSNAGALNAASASWAHTLGGGSNTVLTVLIGSASLTARTVSSVTYGAQSLSQLSGTQITNSFMSTDIWYLIAPSGNQTVNVTMSGSCELYCGAIVAKDAAQTSTFGTALWNTGTGPASPSTATATVSSGTDQFAVALCGHADVGTGALTTTAGTERWNLTDGPGTSRAAGADITGSATASFAWLVYDSSVTDWVTAGVSIKAGADLPAAGIPLMGQAML